MSGTRNTSEDYIGLDMIYIAEVTADDSSAYTASTPIYFAPAAALSKNTNGNATPTYYDNGVYRVLTSETTDELVVNVPALDLETLAMITNKTIDATSKALIDTGATSAKYFALMARALMSDYTYRYFCWQKGSFAIPPENINTIGEGVEPQGQEVTFTAIKTRHEFTVGSASTGVKRIIADARDNTVNVANWFSAVVTPANIPLISG